MNPNNNKFAFSPLEPCFMPCSQPAAESNQAFTELELAWVFISRENLI
jgi:hypothetical protein